MVTPPLFGLVGFFPRADVWNRTGLRMLHLSLRRLRARVKSAAAFDRKAHFDLVLE
jgi:hypothetical protein